MTSPSTTQAATCPSCGEHAPAGHQFCMRCGSALPALAAVAPPPPAVAPSAGPLAKARRFSPAMFGAILVCLLLPFVTISCQYGGPNVTFSGVDLVVGKVVDNGSYQERVDGLPQAIWIVAAAVAGLAASFLKPARLAAIPALAGLVGAAAMLWVRQGLITAAEIQGAGQFVVDFGIGFQLALLFFVIAAVINGIAAVQAVQAPPARP